MSEATPGATPPGGSRTRRRWRRMALASVAVLLVLVVAAIGFYVSLPTPARLVLPATVAAPSGALDGSWVVADGSTAGFRLQEIVVGLGHDIVGRTSRVTGSAELSAHAVTGASFQVDLTTITNKGEPMPQLGPILETARYPTATVSLAAPIQLTPAFDAGDVLSGAATADLVLHGVSHPVTITLSARRDGATIVAAGSMAVSLGDWAIVQPQGFGALGSLADHGEAEFLLVLRHS